LVTIILELLCYGPNDSFFHGTEKGKDELGRTYNVCFPSYTAYVEIAGTKLIGKQLCQNWQRDDVLHYMNQEVLGFYFQCLKLFLVAS
jgi:hypothetical protein